MAFSMSNLNASEVSSVSAALQNPGELGNNAEIEMQWAVKAMEHAEVHYNLLTSVDASLLKLTKADDIVYASFRQTFPDLDVSILTEDSLKSPEAKEKWREFCEALKSYVADYNQGTLLRLDCKGGYDQENTIFSVRTQFLAIEIARNREGHNSCLFKKKDAAKS